MARARLAHQFLTYLLEDGESFSPTEFKMINRQTALGLLPCQKTMYNGQVKLYYHTEGYVSVAAAADRWRAEETLGYIRQLAETMIAITDNGFIRPDTVDLELSHIFVDEHTHRIALVALPLEQENGPSTMKLDNTMKKAFLRIAELSDAAGTPMLREWRRGIESCRQIPEEVPGMIDRILKREPADAEKTPKKEPEKPEGPIRLTAKNTSRACSMLIDKDDFVIGKQASVVDGVVDLSNTVSRRHCRITRKEDGYYLEDLGSSNHTFLNGRRLESGEQVKLLPGDTVRLAEIEFDVKPA